MNLFRLGEYYSHSGVLLPDKIECDALSKADWECLAARIRRKIAAFGRVVAVPRGGEHLQACLSAHVSPEAPATLLVDDVLTTGRSMEGARAELIVSGTDPASIVGYVVFARGKLPPWCRALYTEEP